MNPLTRRGMLALAAGGIPRRLAAGETRPLLKPKALRPGDTVGVIMPSTHVPDPDKLAGVARTVEYFGLKLKPGRYLGRRTWNFAQSIGERVAELHDLFRDPEVKAVMPVRGGYGTMQFLDRIDYGVIRANPKIFTGYSDITAMHLAFHRLAGLVTFHSPVILSEFTGYTRAAFRKALFEAKPLGAVANPAEDDTLRPRHPLRTVRAGKARGPLVGGNLTLLCATMGTPYEIETEGRILFLEDVGEETYSIDRMLMQLWLAGKLQKAAGIVWGECSGCGPQELQPSSATPFTLGETIDHLLGRLDIPVVAGLTIGHTADQATLPLGVMASLDASRGELTIEESATVSG